MNFFSQWDEVDADATYDNGFKLQWEDFIRHVCADTAWHHGLIEGVKGVQLAELGLQSWKERRWLDVPEIKI
jgi:predicted dehydrogenase